ncbi:hypothetical protein COOONC_22060, partial [Cooperia oncophora]
LVSRNTIVFNSAVEFCEKYDITYIHSDIAFTDATRDQIVKETGNPTNVDYIAADLSSMKEVAHFADKVKSRFPDLNVLLCNAGVLNPRRAETADGLEMTFQVETYEMKAHRVALNQCFSEKKKLFELDKR